ncbi:TPA_asm: polyprotein [Cucumis virus 1]|uniref:Replicase n=1 Tax=Cucumis virus 1 TaxID=2977964 RepID=A0A9N6YJ19_9RHAB|nr:TPA_asm: polyprotein [Cucumis virus 1]
MDISSFLDYLNEGEELAPDEKILGDFHLGNAVNLDFFYEYFSPGTIKYNIVIPHYVKRDLLAIESQIEGYHYSQKIGFLEPSLIIQSISREKGILPVHLYKEITRVVTLGMKDRRYQIPIANYECSLKMPDILIYHKWLYCFDMCLKLLCSRSEIMRGGTKPPYDDIVSSGGTLMCKLKFDTANMEILCRQNCTVIISHTDKTVYFGNIDSLLMLLDTIGQRICLYVGNQISQMYGVPGTNRESVLNEILTTGDNILANFGNKGYDIIAMYESIVVSIILRKSPDNIVDHNMFYSSCIEELNDMSQHPQDRDAINEYVQQWTRILERCDYPDLSNIFCLYRCWGHPIVDIRAGMEKVKKIGTEKKSIPKFVEEITLYQFRKMFLTSYFSKENIYPPLTIHDGYTANSYVINRVQKSLPIDDRHPGYDINDFKFIVINKIWNIPLTYDLCHILNDKAVSANQSELKDSILTGNGTSCGTNRRGIIRWLKSESVNCRELLDDINENGLQDDECIIGMYEKEREIKITARMFSLMSEKMRYYFVLTEELIANHILPYFPEITMKDSLNVLLKKMWTIGGIGKESGFDTNINIDFSKWNLNMRYEPTRSVFKQIDMMFGYDNLISQTHNIFEKSYIYSCSGKYMPIVKDGVLSDDPPMAYRGHKGGFEGLRQKGWTVWTVVYLVYMAELSHLKVRLMGQGDNQIVRIIMPAERWKNYELTKEEMCGEASRIVSKYTKTMDIHFELAKLPIKVRETWTSTRLFMYGKMMLHDGMVRPQWYKKILRSYALSNEGQVTLSGVVGTIATNMSAAAGASDSPDVMYIVYLILAEWSLSYLMTYHPFTRKQIYKTHSSYVRIPGKRTTRSMKVYSLNPTILAVSLLTIPTAIGGSVTIPLSGFIMRGFPDHASEGYAWIKMLMSIEGPYQHIFQNWYGFVPNTSIEADMLVQSPWSLNHLRPPTPGLQSRESVRNWLLNGQFNKNQFIKESETVLSRFPRKEVCNKLLTDPMNPLVSSEIFGTFPHVYLDGVFRRVENTRTIKKLTLESGYNARIIATLMEHEHNHLLYMYWRSHQKGVYYSDCATEHARLARNIGWGRTIIGLTTPHPLELCLGQECSSQNTICTPTDHIYIRVDQEGNYAPYLGSKIKNKVISEQDIDARKEPLISYGSRVCRQAEWIGLGENIMDLVIKNIKLVCDIDIYDKFIDLDPKGNYSTGAVDHRFNPAGASEGVFINYAPQLGKKIYMSSDHMTTYGRGQTNYTLHFQALYCWLQYKFSRNDISVYYHQHLDCSKCIVPTADEIPDLIAPYNLYDDTHSKNISEAIQRALGFINLRGNLMLQEPEKIVGFDVDIEMLSEREIRSGLTWTLALRISTNLMYGNESGEREQGLEDLQEYPRIYSYKIYRDSLIKYVGHLLIIIAAQEIGVIPDSSELTKIKKYVLTRINRLPLGYFKGLGGLTIGRSDLDPNMEYLFVIGSYPENITSVLRMVKNALINYISSIGRLHEAPFGCTPLCSGVINSRQYSIMITLKALMTYRCEYYYRNFESLLISVSETPIKCPHDHSMKLYRNLPIIRCSLDKLTKHCPVLTVKKLPREFPYAEYQTFCYEIRSTYGTSRSFPNPPVESLPLTNIYDEYAINLPTKSIYKWCVMSSKLHQRKHIIVLGDGTGGTSFVFSSRFHNSTIYPMALFEHHKVIPQDIGSLMPPLSRNIQNISDHMILNVPDDIFHKDWISRMTDEIGLMGADNVMVVSDIEGVQLNHLWKQLGQLNPKVSLVVKAYYQDVTTWLRDINHISNIQLYTNYHTNSKYGECFVIGDIHKNLHPDEFSFKMGLMHMVEFYRSGNPEIARSEANKIQFIYPRLCKQSIMLALGHLSSLKILVTEDHLKLPAVELWSYIIQYVNNHYKTHEEMTLVRDNRVLNPKLLRELGRGMYIILSTISNSMELKEIPKWTIVKASEQLVPGRKRPLLLLPAVRGPYTFELTRKDIQSIKTLSQFRIKLGMPIAEIHLPINKDSWIVNATKVRSFTSSLSSYSDSDCLDAYDEE